jgi:hypothetical protein
MMREWLLPWALVSVFVLGSREMVNLAEGPEQIRARRPIIPSSQGCR